MDARLPLGCHGLYGRSMRRVKPRDVRQEDDSFVYAIAEPSQHDQIVRVLSESFCREPMAAAVNVSPADLAPLVELFMPECVSNGLSVVAVSKDEPETVAGVFLSRDFKSPLPHGSLDRFTWFLPVAQALSVVDDAYEGHRPGLKLGDAADLWMVGVAAARFARRGIAGKLFETCTEVAREACFGRCVTECTGHFSQTAARRAGYQEMARLAYRDFRFNDEPVFAGIREPHTHLILFEKQLH